VQNVMALTNESTPKQTENEKFSKIGFLVLCCIHISGSPLTLGDGKSKVIVSTASNALSSNIARAELESSLVGTSAISFSTSCFAAIDDTIAWMN
jgi:hypothetical protein